MDEEPLTNYEYEETEEAEEEIISQADQIKTLEKQYNDLVNLVRGTKYSQQEQEEV